MWGSHFTRSFTTCSCEYCEGAVDSSGGKATAETDPISDFCSGSGTCDWSSTQCTCDSGYYGSNCTGVCPGGVSNPCNNAGVCDQVTGICYCECGKGGEECTEDDCETCESKNCLWDGDNYGCQHQCGARVTLGDEDDGSNGYCVGSYTSSSGECSCQEGWYGIVPATKNVY